MPERELNHGTLPLLYFAELLAPLAPRLLLGVLAILYVFLGLGPTVHSDFQDLSERHSLIVRQSVLDCYTHYRP